ncbi:unnamed protein product [Parascedosporium putredinis]|uniref:Uncharacterized protein n=1 Tax=Parascedosporium putredinis TaxID=1442378 RepID=A0A9P1M9E4_9PEZI|nr:unnamed protein product [Parascedosporium putredinis]CAI7990644.1 unnamed protein product [Parascedosporium putredinis]
MRPEDTAIGSFGAPRTGFPSASLRGTKGTFDADRTSKDGDSRGGRFDFRTRNADNDGASSGDRFRDGRNPAYRRRGEGDQDNEGWSTVKPRKSFGPEGAERFNGRMGGVDRYRDDRRTRDRDETDKPNVNRRTYDSTSRDKDAANDENNEGRPRNGVARGKSDTWFKNEAANEGLSARERIDRAKSWRDRDRENDALEDRSSNRTYDRRWGGRDRDQRAERDPEWMDAPADEKAGGHTEEDFKKFLESMKARDGGASSKPAAQPSEPPAEAPKKAEYTPSIEPGPDKFSWHSPLPCYRDRHFRGSGPLNGGHPQHPQHLQHSQHPQHPQHQQHPQEAGLPAPEEEKVAFQQLLMKLQKQSLQVSPAPAAPSSFSEPPHAPPATSSAGPEFPIRAAAKAASPESANVPYGSGGHEPPADDSGKGPSWPFPIIAPQPMLPHQTAAARQDQLLQNLVGHRGDSAQRGDPLAVRNNSNTEFLMNLMRSQPEAPRTEQMMLRMPQPQKSAPIPHVAERDPEFRPMIPPPGLPGGISRNMPLPPGMYPPSFPPGGPGFPGPEAMGGMPPRNMQPPPGIFGAPPPGFFPPPGVGGFQGGPPADVHGFGGPGGLAGHFDARGMPSGSASGRISPTLNRRSKRRHKPIVPAALRRGLPVFDPLHSWLLIFTLFFLLPESELS